MFACVCVRERERERERERDENVLSLPSLALTAVFASFAVHGVVASGRLIAVESSLGEILVEELKTPTGDISVARVNLDDVLYIRLLSQNPTS